MYECCYVNWRVFHRRAPFGLFYHAAWFTQPHHKEGFISFLDTIVAMDDVWVITNWQALQWIRNPTPIHLLKNFAPFGCNYAVSIVHKWKQTKVEFQKVYFFKFQEN